MDGVTLAEEPMRAASDGNAGTVIGEAFADARLGPDLLWRDLRGSAAPHPRGALFVDRDGVLIEERIYLSDPAQVKLIPGAVDLLRAATVRGIPVIAVTNQAGIGRGKFGWQAFSAVERRLELLLADEGIALNAVFVCPFHNEGLAKYRVPNHLWRKPNPGMLFEAARALNLDLARSILVGDKFSDVAAAKDAGLPVAVQVLTGHGPDHAAASLECASPSFQVLIASEPSEAIPLLDDFVAISPDQCFRSPATI